MNTKKTSTVSLANTPVHRALSRAKSSTLMTLLLAGLIIGFIYKTWFKEPSAPPQPPAATAPQKS